MHGINDCHFFVVDTACIVAVLQNGLKRGNWITFGGMGQGFDFEINSLNIPLGCDW